MYTDWRWAELVLRGSHEQQSRQQGPPQFLGSPGGPNFRTETCSKYTLVALPPCEHWDRVWPFAFVFFLFRLCRRLILEVEEGASGLKRSTRQFTWPKAKKTPKP